MKNDTWWLKPSKLDEYQKEIYTLDLDKSYLIIGPPGSGKTNLILLRAKYSIKSNRQNVLIVVFTKTLKRFIASGGTNYELEKLEILTINKLIRDILLQYEMQPLYSGDFETDRIENTKLLEDFLITNKIKNIYGLILIDEAQDFLPIEVRILKRLGKKIFAVADSRQKIYNSESPMDELRKDLDEEKLIFHYRNGKKICKFADGIAKDTDDYENLYNTSHYDEITNASSVKMYKCDSVEDQLIKVNSRLDLQLKTFPEEFIGILCPTNEDLSLVSNFFLNSDFKEKITFISSDNEDFTFNTEKPIIICNLHNAKGLEFRTVHIVCFDMMKKYKRTNRNLTYTAVTRAKTSLRIYHCGDLYGYFEESYSQIEPTNPKPSDDDIFGKNNQKNNVDNKRKKRRPIKSN